MWALREYGKLKWKQVCKYSRLEGRMQSIAQEIFARYCLVSSSCCREGKHFYCPCIEEGGTGTPERRGELKYGVISVNLRV